MAKRKPSKRTLSLRAKKGWETRRAREEFEREAEEFLARALRRQERAEARAAERARALEAERAFLGIPPEEPPRVTPTIKRAPLPVEREGVELPPSNVVVLYTRKMMALSSDEETGEVNDFFFQTVLPALSPGGDLDSSDKLKQYVGQEITFLIAGNVSANIQGKQINEPFNLARTIRGETVRDYIKTIGGIMRDFARLTNQGSDGKTLGSPWSYYVNYVAFIPPR